MPKKAHISPTIDWPKVRVRDYQHEESSASFTITQRELHTTEILLILKKNAKEHSCVLTSCKLGSGNHCDMLKEKLITFCFINKEHKCVLLVFRKKTFAWHIFGLMCYSKQKPSFD